MNFFRETKPPGTPVSEMYTRHSPSSLNLYAACPSMFVLERIMGYPQTVGAIAHRGSAIEAGVAYGLLHPEASEKRAIEVASDKYGQLTALSGDNRREKFYDDIPDMVAQALDELRPLGIPTNTQGYIEEKHPELRLPIVGYYDFMYEDKGLIIDLKTTDKMPSEIKIGHARQVSHYTTDNQEGRLCYCTPKKVQTLRLENAREHKRALVNIAKQVENLLALSNDPGFFKFIVPDLDAFYWKSPASRQLAFEIWGI